MVIVYNSKLIDVLDGCHIGRTGSSKQHSWSHTRSPVLKVLDQINLVENTFCLNFKIRSVFIYRICCNKRFSLINAPRKFAIYLTRFLLFLRKYSILERQISGCEWEKYEPYIGTKISKKLGGGGQMSDLVKDL